MVRPVNRAPRAAGREGSLLRTHARWIFGITLLAVVVACFFAWSGRSPRYTTHVEVLVSADTTHGTPIAANMETERALLLSGVITGDAAWMSGATPARISQGLSVTVPAGSTILAVDYTDTSPADAQRRALAVAKAYCDYRGVQAAIVSYPSAPVQSSGTSYPVSAAAGLVVGLVIAFGSALVRDRLDDGLRGPQDFAEQTELPVVAVVPVPRRPRGAVPPLPVLHDPSSPAAEAYRQARGKVVRAARERPGASAVTVVTSAAEDDGAARLAANLAVSLARSGSQVLLVEADLVSRGLAGLLDIPAYAGLAEVLAGTARLEAVLRPGPVEGMRLLMAGTATDLPGEVLEERRVARLLSEVPADVDHVVVLVPPVLGAAETVLVADQAHLCLLAAVTRRTGRRDARAAAAELAGTRALLLGGVLGQPGRAGRRTRPAGGATPGRGGSRQSSAGVLGEADVDVADPAALGPEHPDPLGPLGHRR